MERASRAWPPTSWKANPCPMPAPVNCYGNCWGFSSRQAVSPALSPPAISSCPRWKQRSEEHTSELQSRLHLVCRLLLEKENTERPPAPNKREHFRTRSEPARLPPAEITCTQP